MPNQFAALDTGFPAFTGKESVAQRVDMLHNYNYMLLEYLRYILRNLGPDNLNTGEMLDWLVNGDGDGTEIDAAVAGGGGDGVIGRVVRTTLTDPLLGLLEGDAAELTADRLLTSRRSCRYLLGDLSPEDHISIREGSILLVTGTPVLSLRLLTEADEPLLTEDGAELEADSAAEQPVTQAQNRYGKPLFWQREPARVTQEGHPLDEAGARIFPTTAVTAWPVLQYIYREAVRARLSFLPEEGTTLPQLVLGEGDSGGNSLGSLFKGTEDLTLRYRNGNGEDAEILLREDGYVELHRLRRARRMDFRSFSQGTFYEVLDGGVPVQYQVDFDAGGRPVKIYDGEHECEVVW